MLSHILSGIAFKAEVLWLPALEVNAVADPARRVVAMIDFIVLLRLYIRLKVDSWDGAEFRGLLLRLSICSANFNKSLTIESSSYYVTFGLG